MLALVFPCQQAFADRCLPLHFSAIWRSTGTEIQYSQYTVRLELRDGALSYFLPSGGDDLRQ